MDHHPRQRPCIPRSGVLSRIRPPTAPTDVATVRRQRGVARSVAYRPSCTEPTEDDIAATRFISSRASNAGFRRTIPVRTHRTKRYSLEPDDQARAGDF